VKEPRNPSSLNLATIFPFDLDSFQTSAIEALDRGSSVVVCAPTGAGKTLIGEYAIYRALSRRKRVFYTTPLKALSNQKFRDFQEKFGRTPTSGDEESPLLFAEVGLITGDIVINPDASVVVMTTEIFRNMLYETPIGQVGTSLENVETLVLDECHYISDKGRGTVWEESIIYCPNSIQLVALSATIGNPRELTDWINHVRASPPQNDHDPNALAVSTCELIDSDFRPVPLRFYFATKEGIFPLLDPKQSKLNPRLKGKTPSGKQRRLKREDCPSIASIVGQLRDRDMLPAIYVIFSRKGCDNAILELRNITLVNAEEARAIYYRLLLFFLEDNAPLQSAVLSFFAIEHPELQQKLLAFLAANPHAAEDLLTFLFENPARKNQLFEFLAEASQLVRSEQVEPLTRGIAAHHAGILPLWKELVEQLFESGLVKVVFATATLSAGINMPARTTVISALSKRTDDGHSMLTPSEFVQIAGRAGRRGMDAVGHVVTLQTPFEGAKEAAFLATASPEPLQSCFTPSYGMVLNLLQKHSLEECKDLLERSFAEYLARLKLTPERQAITALTTELAKLDMELAGIDRPDIVSYEKLRERLREEERIYKILHGQVEASQRQEIHAALPDIPPGTLLHLKGKHIKLPAPARAVFVTTAQGSGQVPALICLSEDNRWYLATYNDVTEIDQAAFPDAAVAKLIPPPLENLPLGGWRKGEENTLEFASSIADRAIGLQPVPELIEQAQRIEIVNSQIADHPLQQRKNPGRLIKLYHDREITRDRLHKTQIKYQKQQSRKSYYWEEFLDLIEILRQFNALEGYTPTPLGEAAAIIRGENELWLGLVFMSGDFDRLTFPQLAAAVSAVITEPPRPDTWCNYAPLTEVIEAFRQGENNATNLREIRRQVYQAQSHREITIPVWLETQLMGIAYRWALGTPWAELCENTNLDEGDLVRLLRRTVDLLWQIPQIHTVSPVLRENARAAVTAMKRFPI
jgi:superfamily II RNA helicase